VLHDLNLAAAFCDQLILMDQGRIAAFGPTPEALSAANLETVFGVRAAVRWDEFAQGRVVVFQKNGGAA
jgi:iron complex transport system ATP-binding protein